MSHRVGAPEGEHDEQDAPAAQRVDHGKEPGEQKERDALLLVETDEEQRQQHREGAEGCGHEAVGATEERGAVGGRGVSDDEGIGFHTLHLSPFPRQSSQWGYIRLSKTKAERKLARVAYSINRK